MGMTVIGMGVGIVVEVEVEFELGFEPLVVVEFVELRDTTEEE